MFSLVINKFIFNVCCFLESFAVFELALNVPVDVLGVAYLSVDLCLDIVNVVAQLFL